MSVQTIIFVTFLASAEAAIKTNIERIDDKFIHFDQWDDSILFSKFDYLERKG